MRDLVFNPKFRVFNQVRQIKKSSRLLKKMKTSTPLKYEAIFQDRGSFIYFKNGNTKLLSSGHNTKI